MGHLDPSSFLLLHYLSRFVKALFFHSLIQWFVWLFYHLPIVALSASQSSDISPIKINKEIYDLLRCLQKFQEKPSTSFEIEKRKKETNLGHDESCKIRILSLSLASHVVRTKFIPTFRISVYSLHMCKRFAIITALRMQH